MLRTHAKKVVLRFILFCACLLPFSFENASANFTGSPLPSMPPCCDGFTHYISASGVEYVYFFNTQDDYQNYVDQGQPGALHVFANNNGPALWPYHVRTVYQLVSGNWQKINPGFWPNDSDHMLDRYKTLPEQISSTTDLRTGYNQNFIDYFGFSINPDYASVVMTANTTYTPPPVTPPPAFTGSSRPPMPSGCDGFTHYISASGVEYVYFFNTQDDYQNYVDQGQPGALHVFANNNGPALWYYHVRTVYQLVSGNWQEISPSFWPNDPDHMLDRYKTLPEQICSTTDLRAGYNQNFIEYFGFCINPAYASVVMTANCSLAPPKPTLTVTLDPVAGGKVTGPGINCGADCTQSYNPGRKVTLTATRNPGYKFKYWDDGTTKYTQNRITITMDSNKSVTAKFGWPTIAQSPMSGPPGTTFVQWGTDFTPNKTATLHIKKPDGSEYTPQTVKLDKFGHFEIPYTSSASKPVGIYTWWANDNATKRKSNEVSYEIIQRAATCTAPQKNKALFKIKNPTCRDRWNLEIFYSEFYMGVIQISQDFIKDQIQGVLDLNKAANNVINGFSYMNDIYEFKTLKSKDALLLLNIQGTKTGELLSNILNDEMKGILFTSLEAAAKAISGDWTGAIENEITLAGSTINNLMATISVSILTKRFQEVTIAKEVLLDLFRNGSHMELVAQQHSLPSNATMIDIINATANNLGASNPWYWFDEYDITNIIFHIITNMNITYTKQVEYTKQEK